MNARQARRRRQADPELPSYVRTIIEAHARGVISSAPGAVNHIWVYHDDECDLLARRGACNCSPDVELVTRPTPSAGG